MASRGVASAGLVRTIAYCFLPPCGTSNSLPLITFDDETLELAPCFVACMNSFVLDFVARQKIAGPNLNFFIKRQLAVLPPATYRVRSPWDSQIDVAAWILPRVVELTYTSEHLRSFARAFGFVSGPSRWNDDRRFIILCELNAAFFRLFGVRRDDVDYVLETFPLVRARNEEQFGEYRTKRVILEIYDAMAEAERTGVAYQTHLDPPPADLRVAHQEEPIR